MKTIPLALSLLAVPAWAAQKRSLRCIFVGYRQAVRFVAEGAARGFPGRRDHERMRAVAAKNGAELG